MSKTGWKQVERDAASAIGATRFWANAGEREDIDSPYFSAQVKNKKSLSLSELTLLVEEMTVRGVDQGKIPIVFVKQSCHRPTPLLVILPLGAWRIIADKFLAFLVLEEKGKGREAVARAVKEYVCVLPGQRKRVERFVEKSKKRARSTSSVRR